MKIYPFFVFLFFTICFLPVFVTAQVPESQKFAGNWSGKPELPTAKLEMIFKISMDESGKLISAMDVPAQGAKDLAVTETSVNGDSLKLLVGMIMGKFEGKLISDTVVEGMWTQRGARLPLTLKKVAVITEQKRPQTPKEPFPYVTEEVEYVNPASGLKLAGTLTVPENAKNCPAVILITGSGAQDRDETIFGHRPFAVIADFLTRNGVAVLRVDDRGVGGSEGNLTEATSEDFAADVMTGIQFLKSKKTIDAGEIGLIGHSEGGLVAPMVAAKTNDVAFIVLLAGPGVKGEEILYAQNDLVLAAAGMDRDVIDRNRQLQKAIFDILLNEKDSVKQIDRLQRTYSGGMYPMLNDEQKKAIDTQVNAVNNRWFRFFLSYDPYPTLTRVKCPVLALNGAKDVQVPARQNLEAVQKALAEGGNGRFKTIQLENLNHLFQHCKTGAVAEYGQIEETISPEVLEIIDGWIQEVVQKN
jgi:pimeloyl-ACP methyl ester carboxylesterase